MSIRLKVFLFVVWILILMFLITKLKSKKADIKYILPWLMLDAGMMVITVFPQILTFFCRLFGIETPSNMLFFFALVFLARKAVWDVSRHTHLSTVQLTHSVVRKSSMHLTQFARRRKFSL